MKTFVKFYIGKAKKVKGLEIIKLNLKISDLIKYAHKYNDQDYISMEVAKLQNPDSFGNDYTVYVSQIVETSDQGEPKPEEPARPSRKKKAAKKQPADIPF